MFVMIYLLSAVNYACGMGEGFCLWGQRVFNGYVMIRCVGVSPCVRASWRAMIHL